MRAWADRRVAESPGHRPRSDTNFTTKLNSANSPVYVGYVGEAVFWSEHRGAVRAQAQKGYDFTLGTRQIEVKTRMWSIPPQPRMIFPLRPDEIRKTTDLYFFIHLHSSHQFAWIVGWKSVADVDQIAKFMPAGTLQTDNPRFRYKIDEREMPLREMNPGETLRKEVYGL